MWQRIREIVEYREMLRNLVHKELRARYKGSALGFMWTFFHPLLLLIIYSFVFSFIMRVQMENYSLYLFAGLLPWTFHITSLTMGTNAIVGNSNLITKIYFPREILPLSVVLANMFNYLLSLPILIGALIYLDWDIGLSLLAFPLVLLIQTLMITGLTLIVSAVNVFFRDLEHLLSVLLTGWFFLCPIVYPISMIPEDYVGIYTTVNPVTPLIIAYTDIFYYSRFPEWSNLLAITGFAIIIFAIGFILFNRLQKSFAEEV